jgi:hypothetical protein
MRRLLACFLAVALVWAGAAVAGRGDPQERLTAADNARAKSMVLRRSDLPPFAVASAPKRDDDFYCRAVDESDLTVTGKAEGPFFVGRLEAVRSFATIYRSLGDANSSWRRGSSAAGVECLRRQALDEVKGTGTRVVSVQKRAAPRVGTRSLGFRVVFQRQDGVRVYVDAVVIQQSRAHVALVFEGLGGSVTPRFVSQLSRTLADRMRSAMRG